MQEHTRRGLSLMVAVVALGIGLSACGIAGDDTDSDPVAGADAQDAGLEFAACMRENGVDVPDPEPGAGGEFTIGTGEDLDIESPAFKAAEEACAQILQDAIPDGVERATEVPEGALDYAACMREQGIDFPDPKIEDGMTKIGPEGDLPVDDAEMKAADQACRALMPTEEEVPSGAPSTP